MANRKKTKRRGRRVGGLKLGGKDTGMKLLAVGAGFLLGSTVNGMIDKMLPKDAATPTVPSKNAETIATVGQIGLGGLLLMRRQSGTAGLVMKAAGGLLAGAGVKRALRVLGVVTGYQSVPVIGRHRMAGYQSTPVIGRAIPSQLAGGVPPQLSGYRPAGSGVGGYVSAGSGVMGSIGSIEGGSGITNTGGSSYMG